jgi:hypothetical protein
MRARALDEALRDVVSTTADSIYIALDFDAVPERFADDGYHPSEYGYHDYGRTMAERIAPVLSAKGRVNPQAGGDPASAGAPSL